MPAVIECLHSFIHDDFYYILDNDDGFNEPIDRCRCEVIKDWKTGESLSYAFIEFADRKSCEEAYFKMDNVLIDDRRIHVDFSQSVSKQAIGKDGRLIRNFGGFPTHAPSAGYELFHSRSRDLFHLQQGTCIGLGPRQDRVQ